MHSKTEGFSLEVAFRRYRFQLIFLLLLLAQWTLLFSPAGPSWDATFYYAYARSPVFDGDLRIDNDLQLAYPAAALDFAAARIDLEKTETGRVASPFAIGSSLLWLPWLAILRGLAGLGQLVGLVPQDITGQEWYFVAGVATLSMVLGWLAFWLAYRLALQVGDKTSAGLATLTALFATPLLFYMYREALYAHATAAFITALFITVWWRRFRSPTSYAWALTIGGLLGLAGLVRWQHLVYAVLPLSTIVCWWLSLAAGEKRPNLGRAVLLAALVCLGVLAVFSLQLAHWRMLFGQWITVPQGAGFMNWTAPYWRQVLFSTFKGLLPWMPLFFLALAGLLLQLKKQRQFLLPLLIVLLLETYINSSSTDWFGGGGYGPRRFTGELAILVIGYAGLLQCLPRKARVAGGGTLAGLLLLHQWLLLRFGLSSEIGGRVLSLSPSFDWAETGYATYLRQLGALLGDSFGRPERLLHWPDSPLGALFAGEIPLRQMSALAASAVFVSAIWLVTRRLLRERTSVSPRTPWILLALLGLALLAANFWILTRA